MAPRKANSRVRHFGTGVSFPYKTDGCRSSVLLVGPHAAMASGSSSIHLDISRDLVRITSRITMHLLPELFMPHSRILCAGQTAPSLTLRHLQTRTWRLGQFRCCLCPTANMAVRQRRRRRHYAHGKSRPRPPLLDLLLCSIWGLRG